jgi:SAM-dependent methyltransferase
MKEYIKKTIESYNLTAHEYFENILKFEKLPELDVFVRINPLNANILDLGCGPGQHSKFFIENGFKVVGVDYSKEMIKLAKLYVPNADFHVMNIAKLKFKLNSFDSIWASASLIHIKKEDFAIVLEKLRRILKQDGIFYFSLKEGAGEEDTIDSRYGGVIKFHSYFNKKEIEEYLLNTGFKILDIYKREQRITYDTNPWIHIFAKKC